jgi:hypothetical protein
LSLKIGNKLGSEIIYKTEVFNLVMPPTPPSIEREWTKIALNLVALYFGVGTPDS